MARLKDSLIAFVRNVSIPVLPLLIFVALPYLSGCAGVSAYISSQTAPGQQIDEGASFYFYASDGASIEDRKTTQLIVDEFKKENLKVASEDEKYQAAYLVTVSADKKTSEISGSYPQTQTQNTTVKNSWGFPVATAKTQSTQYVPYSYNYTVSKTYVTIYSTADMANNKRMLSVWEGYIGAGANEFSRFAKCIIPELVSRLGTDYEAHTKIDTSCEEEKGTW